MFLSAISAVIKVSDIASRVYMRLFGYIWQNNEGETFFGAKIKCNIHDFVQRRIYFFHIYEHNLTHYIVDKLRSGDVFVDVGANIGYFSLLASKIVGDRGRVISVEADSSTFRRLGENIAANSCGNVRALNVAATESFCTVSMHRTDVRNSGANAIVRQQDGSGDVPGRPLADIVGEDLSRIRFIKIDIEGSEGPILKEIIGLLERLPPDLIIASEVSPASEWSIAAFKEAGFGVYAMPNNYKIDYYCLRNHLRLCGEHKFINLVPIESYDRRYTDYIFERRSLASGVFVPNAAAAHA
jgi:FkbM family methyltransferase